MTTQEQVTLVLTTDEAWQVRCAIEEARIFADSKDDAVLASAAEKLHVAAKGFKA